ncbi:MAG: hypothetical protein ABFD77_04985 [Thermotogota bacterium]
MARKEQDEPALPYVPRTYRRDESAPFVLWTSPCETGEHRACLRSWAFDAMSFLSEALGFRPSRRLHVVSFRTNEEARLSLGREVPSAMALAPYAGEADCLVVVQSASVDSRNADPDRMRGILVHEMAHQLIAERTGSTKLLGDGNRCVNVSTWLNEGLAELLRFQFLHDAARIEGALGEFERARDILTWRDVDGLLDDLDADRRAEAFVRATGAVAWLAREAGVVMLFDRLAVVDHAVAPNSGCAVPALRPVLRRLSA